MKVLDYSGWQITPYFDNAPDVIDGVILKISEGSTIDGDFETNIKGVIEQGMPWGVYCFTHATTQFEASQEANAVTRELAKIESIYGSKPSLRVWFDVEADEVLALGQWELTQIAMTFFNWLTSNDYQVGIYGNYYCLRDEVDKTGFPDYIAWWSAEPDSYQCDFKVENPDLNVVGWQYNWHYYFDGQEFDINEWYE